MGVAPCLVGCVARGDARIAIGLEGLGFDAPFADQCARPACGLEDRFAAALAIDHFLSLGAADFAIGVGALGAEGVADGSAAEGFGLSHAPFDELVDFAARGDGDAGDESLAGVDHVIGMPALGVQSCELP